ncbi:MAG: CHAD domain-containing protein [Hyphomicrobium sp.]|nr:CHAD domain-containing protein [Hyphomicrobium sp.]
MGEAAFKRENAQLREIGLSLSGARDRHVLLETVNKLEGGAGLGRKGLIANVRACIAAANGDGPPPSMQQAQDRLADTQKRLAELPIEGSGFDVVAAGLERSYRKARRAFREAYDKPSDEAFHEWRKGAQAHWRQMTLLSRAWPEYLDARAGEARCLSQLIGDDHDLALLVAFVHSDVAAGLGNEQGAIVEKAARQRQAELREAARPRGERLFAEAPKRLRDSIGVYWRSAVGLKERELDEASVAETAKRVRRHSAPRRRTTATGKGAAKAQAKA